MTETDPRRILFPVRVPDWMGSVRFRLTVIYSLILFGLAAAVVGGIYLGLAASLDDEPVHQSMPVHIVEVTPVPGGVVIEGNQGTAEMRSLEEEVNQRALDVLRTYSFGALGLLFVASLGVGWIVAGRALAPIHRITKVARNIQATDLKRRIHLGGPPDELRELADTFDEMLTRIDEAFEGQRRFIHEASHELRNPLAVIRTNLDVAMADPDASVDDLRETGAIVQNAAGRMTHLVDDLLLYARQEVPSYDVAPIDVSDLVAMAAAEFRAPAEARSIAVESASEPDLWVTGDRVALRQALANLLANAVRLAPEGGQIRVAAGRQTGWIWMAVEDQGPGIAEEDQAAVFQRFWRGEDPPGRRGTRSGLGLSIVRQIAEAHHGEVRLTSTEGVGSTFSLWLPTAVRPVPEREQVPDPPARETPEPAR